MAQRKRTGTRPIVYMNASGMRHSAAFRIHLDNTMGHDHVRTRLRIREQTGQENVSESDPRSPRAVGSGLQNVSVRLECFAEKHLTVRTKQTPSPGRAVTGHLPKPLPPRGNPSNLDGWGSEFKFGHSAAHRVCRAARLFPCFESRPWR